MDFTFGAKSQKTRQSFHATRNMHMSVDTRLMDVYNSDYKSISNEHAKCMHSSIDLYGTNRCTSSWDTWVETILFIMSL